MIGPPAFGYVRVSTEDQARSGLGLQAQIDQVITYSELKGLALAKIYRDAGVSGATPLLDRPQGGLMIQDALAHPTPRELQIIVPKLDRAWRSLQDCCNTLSALDRAGIGLHLIDLGGNTVDTRSPSGKFMLHVLGAAAEMERDLIRQRTREALQSSGKVLGRAPFGKSLSEDRSELTINPLEQKVLRTIFKKSEAGWSSRRIASYLTQRGIPTPSGRQGWSRRTVSKILARGREA